MPGPLGINQYLEQVRRRELDSRQREFSRDEADRVAAGGVPYQAGDVGELAAGPATADNPPHGRLPRGLRRIFEHEDFRSFSRENKLRFLRENFGAKTEGISDEMLLKVADRNSVDVLGQHPEREKRARIRAFSDEWLYNPEEGRRSRIGDAARGTLSATAGPIAGSAAVGVRALQGILTETQAEVKPPPGAAEYAGPESPMEPGGRAPTMAQMMEQASYPVRLIIREAAKIAGLDENTFLINMEHVLGWTARQMEEYAEGAAADVESRLEKSGMLAKMVVGLEQGIGGAAAFIIPMGWAARALKATKIPGATQATLPLYLYLAGAGGTEGTSPAPQPEGAAGALAKKGKYEQGVHGILLHSGLRLSALLPRHFGTAGGVAIFGGPVWAAVARGEATVVQALTESIIGGWFGYQGSDMRQRQDLVKAGRKLNMKDAEIEREIEVIEGMRPPAPRQEDIDATLAEGKGPQQIMQLSQRDPVTAELGMWGTAARRAPGPADPDFRDWVEQTEAAYTKGLAEGTVQPFPKKPAEPAVEPEIATEAREEAAAPPRPEPVVAESTTGGRAEEAPPDALEAARALVERNDGAGPAVLRRIFQNDLEVDADQARDLIAGLEAQGVRPHTLHEPADFVEGGEVSAINRTKDGKAWKTSPPAVKKAAKLAEERPDSRFTLRQRVVDEGREEEFYIEEQASGKPVEEAPPPRAEPELPEGYFGEVAREEEGKLWRWPTKENAPDEFPDIGMNVVAWSNETNTISLADKRQVTTVLGFVDAGDLVGSHQRRGSDVIRNDEYPHEGGFQTRRYESDDIGRLVEQGLEGEFDDNMVYAPSPSAEMGPIVVVPIQNGRAGGAQRDVRLVIAGGNGRKIMFDSMRREQLHEYANKWAKAYGAHPTDIEGMPRPIPVQIMLNERPTNKQEAEVLSSQLNESVTRDQTSAEKGKLLASQLSEDVYVALDKAFEENPDATLTKILDTSRTVGNAIRKSIPPKKHRTFFVKKTGALTPQGKREIEDAILTGIVPDQEMQQRMSPSFRNRLVRLAPTIINAKNAAPGYLDPIIRDAVRSEEVREASGNPDENRPPTNLATFLESPDMGMLNDVPSWSNEFVRSMHRALADGVEPLKLARDRFARFRSEIEDSKSGDQPLFGPVIDSSPEVAFEQAFFAADVRATIGNRSQTPVMLDAPRESIPGEVHQWTVGDEVTMAYGKNLDRERVVTIEGVTPAEGRAAAKVTFRFGVGSQIKRETSTIKRFEKKTRGEPITEEARARAAEPATGEELPYLEAIEGLVESEFARLKDAKLTLPVAEVARDSARELLAKIAEGKALNPDRLKEVFDRVHPSVSDVQQSKRVKDEYERAEGAEGEIEKLGPGDLYMAKRDVDLVPRDAPLPSDMVTRGQIIEEPFSHYGWTVSFDRLRARGLDLTGDPRGFYRPSTGWLKVRNWWDFQTAFHELGHAMADHFPRLREAFKLDELDENSHADQMLPEHVKEMIRMSYEKTLPKEGFAELWRQYLTRYGYFRTNAPHAAASFDSFMKSLPAEDQAMWRRVQDQSEKYFAQGAGASWREQQGRQGTHVWDAFQHSSDKFRALLVDAKHGLGQLEMAVNGYLNDHGVFFLARAHHGISWQAQRLNHDGAPVYRQYKGDNWGVEFQGDGLMTIHRRALGANPSQTELENFLHYRDARRAQSLGSGAQKYANVHVRELLNAEELAEADPSDKVKPQIANHRQKVAVQYGETAHEAAERWIGERLELDPADIAWPTRDGVMEPDGRHAKLGLEHNVGARYAVTYMDRPSGKTYTAKEVARMTPEDREAKLRGAQVLSPNVIEQGLRYETPEFKQGYQDLVDFNRKVAQFAIDTGLINYKQLDSWPTADYVVSFAREMEGPRGSGVQWGDRTGPLGSKRPVYNLKGGHGQQFKDPLSRSYEGAARMLHAAEENMIRQRTANLLLTKPGGIFGGEIKKGMEAWDVKVVQLREAILAEAQKAASLTGVEIPADFLQGDWLPEAVTLFRGGRELRDPTVMTVFFEGKPRHFELHDPSLMMALQSLHKPALSLVAKWANVMRRTLQTSVTRSPDFIVGQLARDPLMNYAFSRFAKIWPADFMLTLFEGYARSARFAMTGNDPLVKEVIQNMGGGGLIGEQGLQIQPGVWGMDSGGVIDRGSIVSKTANWLASKAGLTHTPGMDYRRGRGIVKMALRENVGVSAGQKALGYLPEPGAAIRMLDRLVMVTEMGPRMGEVIRAKAAGKEGFELGKHYREASVDFSQGGAHSAFNGLAVSVPFLRAQVASWDRVYRAVGAGRGVNKAAAVLGRHDLEKAFRMTHMDEDAKVRTLLKVALMSASSGALHYRNMGIQDYQDEDPIRKLLYNFVYLEKEEVGPDGAKQYHKYMIPRPYDTGFFGAITDMMVQQMLETEDPEHFDKAMGLVYLFSHNFGMNLPPGIDAAMKKWANWDRFSKSPVLTQGIEGLPPWQQVRGDTSRTMEYLGQLTQPLPQAWQLSPAMAEEILESFLATWPQMVLGVMDRAFFNVPAKRLDEQPGLRRILGKPEGTRTKNQRAFYAYLREARQAHASMAKTARAKKREDPITHAIHERQDASMSDVMRRHYSRLESLQEGIKHTTDKIRALGRNLGEIPYDPAALMREKVGLLREREKYYKRGVEAVEEDRRDWREEKRGA